MLKGLIAAAAMVALPVTGAQACWNDSEVAAAKIRDMETMLMVSALRCRLSGNDILPEYNGFVRQSRVALTQVNDDLRRHFAPRGGLNAYDRYVTSIANRYGAGADGLSCDDMASILSAAVAEGGSYAGLARLADAAGVDPVLEGGRCTLTVARR
jgi:alpha-D-ribose 1-methylphosphonate 5-triphosphate diphosphatase PhnM